MVPLVPIVEVAAITRFQFNLQNVRAAVSPARLASANLDGLTSLLGNFPEGDRIVPIDVVAENLISLAPPPLALT